MALCPSHRTSGSPCPRQRAESPRGRQGCHMVWLEAESCLVGASPAHAHWPLGPSLAMQGPLTLWSSGDSPSQRLRPGRPWDESSARTRKDVGEIREILCHCGLRCPAGSYSPPHPLSPAAFQGPDFPLPPGWLQPPAPVSPVVFRGRGLPPKHPRGGLGTGKFLPGPLLSQPKLTSCKRYLPAYVPYRCLTPPNSGHPPPPPSSVGFWIQPPKERGTGPQRSGGRSVH